MTKAVLLWRGRCEYSWCGNKKSGGAEGGGSGWKPARRYRGTRAMAPDWFSVEPDLRKLPKWLLRSGGIDAALAGLQPEEELQGAFGVRAGGLGHEDNMQPLAGHAEDAGQL